MPDRTTSSAEICFEESDTWPWQCLDCGTTIYHDGDFCRVCGSSHRLDSGDSEPNSSNGFIGWMRDQSLSAFVLKTTAVAGIELVLTAFWLQTALVRSLEMGTALPMMG